MKYHDSPKSKIYCHYFNNDQHCPFEKFVCKFLHEDSGNCRYMKKCKRNMCQFKHGPKSHEAPMDKHQDMEAMDVMDDHDDSSPEFIEARKIECAAYCDQK